MQVLMGDVAGASRSLNNFFKVREKYGFLPERFDYDAWSVEGGDTSGGAAKHPLRPEVRACERRQSAACKYHGIGEGLVANNTATRFARRHFLAALRVGLPDAQGYGRDGGEADLASGGREGGGRSLAVHHRPVWVRQPAEVRVCL